MRKVPSIIICLFFAFSAFSQSTIVINDANFLAALILEGVDTDGSNDIQESEALAVDTLDIADQEILSVSGLESFLNLKVLNCKGNELSVLNITALEDLRVLNCGWNNITELDISTFDSLMELDCTSNEISSLSVLHVPKLKSLVFSNSLVDSINLSLNPLVELLSCGNTALTTIDLTHNPSLKQLHFSDTDIRALDVSQNGQLELMSCSHNRQMTSMNMDGAVSLEEFYCSGNATEFIDLSNNPALRRVECVNSPELMYLDVKNGQGDSLWVRAIGNTALSCIQVNDMTAANNNVYPYSDWTYPSGVTFSEDCFNVTFLKESRENESIVRFNVVSSHIILEPTNVQSYRFTDINGALLKAGLLRGEKNIDIEEIPSGAYVLQLQLETGDWVSERIFKQ
jgi:hypothetical protein